MKALNPSTGNYEKIFVKALDSLPIGTSIEYSGSTIPSDLEGTWVWEEGQEFSRTEYARLFALIGTTYGSGDGSTTFNIPNKKGRVAVGLDSTQTVFNTLGKTGGSKELQEHTHSMAGHPSNDSYTWAAPNQRIDYIFTEENPYPANVVTSAAGTGNSGNLQPYIVKRFLYKVKETTPNASSTLNAHSNSTKNTYSCNYIEKLFGLDQDTYSSSSTYAVGDLVIHNGAIYECTTAIITAEAWNSAHWTIVPIFV